MNDDGLRLLGAESGLPLAESLALGAKVVAQHGAENEVLFGSELVERTCDDEANGVETLAATEIDVDVVSAR